MDLCDAARPWGLSGLGLTVPGVLTARGWAKGIRGVTKRTIKQRPIGSMHGSPPQALTLLTSVARVARGEFLA